MRIFVGNSKLRQLNRLIFVCALILGSLLIWQCNFMAKTITVENRRVNGAENIVKVNNHSCNSVDFEYVAKCVIAEAGTESEYCKRLVADCIFNQSELHDLTPSEIINAPNNFEVVSKGMIKKSIVKEEDLELVREEFFSRTSSDVLYFRTDYYHSFGKPYKCVKNMYFSVG